MNIKYLFITFLVFILTNCKLDNFDAPTSQLKGRFVYNGEALQMRGTGGDGDQIINAVQIDERFENVGTIPIFVNSNGEFNNLMYDGHYKLVVRQDKGPWIPIKDSIDVYIDGNTNLDIEVTPYFMLKNSEITLDNNVVNVKTDVEQIVEYATISELKVYLSSTQFVDDRVRIGEYTCPNSKVGSNEFNFDFSNDDKIKNSKFLFARVAVKANGANEYIFSNVIQLR